MLEHCSVPEVATAVMNHAYVSRSSSVSCGTDSTSSKAAPSTVSSATAWSGARARNVCAVRSRCRCWEAECPFETEAAFGKKIVGWSERPVL